MNERKKSWVPGFFFVLGMIVCAGVMIIFWRERGYYFLPLAERPLHPHHEILRSSGQWGLSVGIVGTLLMFLNLTYLLRKQLIGIEWLGALRSWMAFHVFTGLVGGALILFHSAFLPRSVLGILGFVSTAIVVFTGLVGRYIYARTPRSLEGRELELDEIRKHLEVVRSELAQLGVGAAFFKEPPAIVSSHEKGLVSALIDLLGGDRDSRREFARLRAAIGDSPRLRSGSREILSLARRFHTERQWILRYYELRGLMGRWRYFHRWFAIVLLVMAVFHIAVAVRLGNLWFLQGVR